MRLGMGLFDVHAHLTHERFAETLDVVIARARAAGVTTVVCNGLNAQDNERVLALSRRYPEVRPALGFYPVDVVLPEMLAAGVEYPRDEPHLSSVEETMTYLREHVGSAFAIGEIGLDHHWVPEPFWPRQEAIFRELVELAQAADLPIIIHTRKAERRTFEILLEMQAQRVNWHCFSSRLKLARQIAEAGHYLSIPANARRSETFTGMLRSLPRQNLMLETDCPYLAPQPGMVSEPAHVAQTMQYASEIWGVTSVDAQRQFEQNFERLFGCPP